MPDSKKPFDVPSEYYIRGGAYSDVNFGNYCLNEEGNFYVAVRKSLDFHPGISVEHITDFGNLVISDGKNKSFAEGLDEIRDGIERLIDGCSDCMGRFWNRKPRT